MKKEDIKQPENDDLEKFFEEVSLAIIKEQARQAFREQQSQDTEGGVPCAVSFICGFRTGYREALSQAQKLYEKKLVENQKHFAQGHVEIRQLQKGEDL